jgi:pilus assembly protein Flp/PilA
LLGQIIFLLRLLTYLKEEVRNVRLGSGRGDVSIGRGNQDKDKIMKTLFNRFIKDESGATAIEYGLIAALVAVMIIAGLNVIGPQLRTTFNSVGTALTNANTTGAGG